MSAEAETIEPGGQTAETDALEPVLGLLRNVWWAGLGVVVLTGEQGTKLVKTAIERGREFEPTVTEPLKKAGQGVGQAAGDFGARVRNVGQSIGRGAGQIENMVDQRVAKVFSEVAAPIRSQLDSLSERIEALTEKVEELRKQRSAQPADS